MEPKATPVLYCALFITLFIISSSFSAPMMAGPYIIGVLGGSNDWAIYLLGFFGIGSAIGIPLGKPIAARIGVRQTLTLFLSLFTIATFLAGMSSNYPEFLLCRFLQGLFGGPILPLLSYLFFMLPEEKMRSKLISIFVNILISAPLIGGCFNGVTAYLSSWRYGFFGTVPWIIMLIIFLPKQLKRFSLPLKKEPFDTVGFIAFALGLSSLGFALITGQTLDWYRSPLFVSTFLIGIFFLPFFILWSLRVPCPLLDLRAFFSPTFSLGIFFVFFLMTLYFATVTLLPLWLNLYVSYTPLWIGLLLLGMGVAAFIPPILVLKKWIRIEPYDALLFGIFFIGITCFYTTIFNVDINFDRIVASRFLAGVGLACFLPAIFELCLIQFPKERSIDLIAIIQVVRSGPAAIGTCLIHTLWQRRDVFFHARLGEGLSTGSIPTETFFDKARLYEPTSDPYALLNFFLERQSRALSLNDVFWLMGWICVALFCLMLPIRLYSWYTNKSKS